MIDVDYFKLFNDSMGHQAGDECLRRISAVVRACASRPSDLVARCGGEEFAVVLASTGMDGALRVANQIKRAIHGLGIPHCGVPMHRAVVTVSIGVAASTPCVDRSPSELVSAADEELYAAKAAGRNVLRHRCI